MVVMKVAGSERRIPPGVDPTLTGVLGGKHLSKYSGERQGPKVTLFREPFLVVLEFELPMYDFSRPLFVGAGDGDIVSSTSGMDMREEWRERQEDRREKEDSRDGMGVGTFSLVRLVFKEDGVFISDYGEKTVMMIS